MKISDYAHGRDNNFNLVRILAALAVLFSHSYALTSTGEGAEPFRRTLGETAGMLAVDLFFVASGFLVSGSLLARRDLLEFAWARVLRIWPALLVMLLLTVFGLGLAFTQLSPAAYLGAKPTWAYLAKNATLFDGVLFRLPGVFETNPYGGAVNGSLWTLPLEVWLYATLASLWFALRVLVRARPRVFELAIFGCAGGGLAAHLAMKFGWGTEDTSVRLFFMFFTGVSCQLLRERIPLARGAFWIVLAALLASALDARVFFVVYDVSVAYLLFYVAFVPGGPLRAFNRAGDCSYGVYIYAFPVQQAVVALRPDISVAGLFWISAPVTLALAAASWHLLEKHALGWRRACVDFTRRRS